MSEATDLNLVEAINQSLGQLLEDDPQALLLGEDIGANGGVFRATAGLQQRFGEERVIDTPLSEAGFVGAAIGMCLVGLHPVVEIQFDAFVYPAFQTADSSCRPLPLAHPRGLRPAAGDSYPLRRWNAGSGTAF